MSSPLPIPQSPFGSYRANRARSQSISSSGSPPALSPSASPVSTHSEVQTPQTTVKAPPSPTSSPILSYFFSPSSPVKTPFSTFPFSKSTAPLFEHDETETETPTPEAADNTATGNPIVGRHGRSMSMSASSWGGAPQGRFATPAPATSSGLTAPPPSASADNQERGAGLLRRLSLGAFATSRPTMHEAPSNSLGLAGTNVPQLNTPVPKHAATAPAPRGRGRANVLRVPANDAKARAPSPMGERMLKGHFDGFL